MIHWAYDSRASGRDMRGQRGRWSKMASTRKETRCNIESILEVKTTTEMVQSADMFEKKKKKNQWLERWSWENREGQGKGKTMNWDDRYKEGWLKIWHWCINSSQKSYLQNQDNQKTVWDKEFKNGKDTTLGDHWWAMIPLNIKLR